MNYLEYLVNEIHSTIVATVDENGLPVTCAVDMMDADENGLYFLTAKGKSFYKRLVQSFTFGGAEQTQEGYFINDSCIGCQTCGTVCPQSCIDFSNIPAVINQSNCLHCGNCQSVCPVGAVETKN